jgi:hypothetical protein
MKPIIIIAAGVTLLACGGAREQFTPAERATAQTYEGYTAAEYAIDGRRGELGDAKVFTRGAFRARVDGRERTLVHVGFLIENNARYPIRLRPERLRLDSATVDEYVLQNVEPTRIEGPAVVRPGDEREINVYFALPPGVDPQNVDAFRVSWALAFNGDTYAQRTPFVELKEVYYHTPYYDPFYYDPFYQRPRIISYGYPYRYHGWW